MDLHVVVDGGMTVHDGHEVGHRVQEALLGGVGGVSDVVVHIEPGAAG
jgi:divalent metal cation (Fe/Co/Zn/Cd) transporter